MDEEKNVICIYNDAKEEFEKVVIKIYEKFLDNEFLEKEKLK